MPSSFSLILPRHRPHNVLDPLHERPGVKPAKRKQEGQLELDLARCPALAAMRQRPPSMPHVHPVKGHAPPLSQLVHDPSIKGFKLSARRTTLNVALALLVAWLCLIGPHLRPRSPALAQQPGLEIHQPPPRSNNGLTTEVEWDRESKVVVLRPSPPRVHPSHLEPLQSEAGYVGS